MTTSRKVLTLGISPVQGMKIRIILVTGLFLVTTLALCVGCS